MNWQYLVRAVPVGSQEQATLNQLGSEGWELVDVVSPSDRPFRIFYLKRPSKTRK